MVALMTYKAPGYIWSNCEICGMGRYVQLVYRKPRSRRCRRCGNIGTKRDKVWNSNTRLMEKAYQWKGEKAGYDAKHKFLNKLLGRASCCQINPTHISKKYSWHNFRENGSRNPDDYVSVCESCHRKIHNKNTLTLRKLQIIIGETNGCLN